MDNSKSSCYRERWGFSYKKMYEILNSKGLLYISVPNKYMIDHEQHVRLFERDSIVKLLSSSGFKVISTVQIPSPE